MGERNYNFKQTRSRRLWNEGRQAALARDKAAAKKHYEVERCYRERDELDRKNRQMKA